jgi:hypothetical protein
VTEPAVAPVNETEQLPPDKAQDAASGLTEPDPEVVKSTLPLGENPPEVVAVQVVVVPTLTGEGEQFIEVEVLAFVTVKLKVPELGELLESPEYEPVIVTGEVLELGV